MRWALCKKLQALSILVFSEMGASCHATLKGYFSCFPNPYVVCLVTHLSLVTVSRTGQVAFKLWFDIKMAGKIIICINSYSKDTVNELEFDLSSFCLLRKIFEFENHSAKGGKPTGTH
jgi:hypothetical protein